MISDENRRFALITLFLQNQVQQSLRITPFSQISTMIDYSSYYPEKQFWYEMGNPLFQNTAESAITCMFQRTITQPRLNITRRGPEDPSDSQHRLYTLAY